MLCELHTLNLKLCSKNTIENLFCAWLWCHN